MTFSIHQGRVVMSSQITHTINIHPLAHKFDTWALIFSSCVLFSRRAHPSPGDNHQSTGGRSERTQSQAKWPCETHSVTHVPGLSSLSDLSRIVTQPPPWFLCCPRPPHHPFSLTSVYLVPALQLLQPSTLFWPSGTHPFFPHAQTISVLFGLLYSQLPFYSRPYMTSSLNWQNTNQTINMSFIENGTLQRTSKYSYSNTWSWLICSEGGWMICNFSII